MVSIETFLLLSIAVFCGAFVSSLAGFAFSAVAGAILLHVLQPVDAVPLIMACGVGMQATNLWALRKSLCWKDSLILIFGGLLGVPVAAWLLDNADAHTLRQAFGLAVIAYAGYMLCRPSLAFLQQMKRNGNALVDFGGGLMGGLTAIPVSLPAIWYDMHGVLNNWQLVLGQPFITVMQIS